MSTSTLPYVGEIPPPVAERPICPACRKPRKPRVWGERSDAVPPNPAGGSYPNVRRWTGMYEGYGFFCTLRCCEMFANAVIERMSPGSRALYATGNQLTKK